MFKVLKISSLVVVVFMLLSCTASVLASLFVADESIPLTVVLGICAVFQVAFAGTVTIGLIQMERFDEDELE